MLNYDYVTLGMFKIIASNVIFLRFACEGDSHYVLKISLDKLYLCSDKIFSHYILLIVNRAQN